MSLRRMKIGGLRLAALLFLGAQILRLADEASSSWALAAQETLPPLGECGFSSEQIAAGLDIRQQNLQAKEVILSEKEKALARLEQEIDSRQRDLAAEEARLQNLYAVTSEAAAQDIAQLVAIYEAMKPKEAAALFSQMDPKFAAGFLSKMKAEGAAMILSHMAPDYAYNISAVLASRNLGEEKSPILGAH